MGMHAAFDFSREALLSGEAFDFGDRGAGETGARGQREQDPGGGRDKETSKRGNKRLLATGGAAQAPQAPSSPADAPEISVNVSMDATIEVILQRIEQALRASLHPGADEPLTLKIQLNDLSFAGVKSLSISFTKTGVDVALACEAGQASAELIAAAQGLALQLAARFPARGVRIFETEEEGPVAAHEEGRSRGLDELSALFAKRGV